MLWLSQLTSSPYLCVAIMSVAYTCNGAHYSGDSVNLLGIAPNRYTRVTIATRVHRCVIRRYSFKPKVKDYHTSLI